jgi:hypothetical protein
MYDPPPPMGSGAASPLMGSGAVLQSYQSNDKNLTLSCVFCIFCVQETLAPVHLYNLCIFLQNHNLSSCFDYYLKFSPP